MPTTVWIGADAIWRQSDIGFEAVFPYSVVAGVVVLWRGLECGQSAVDLGVVAALFGATGGETMW